MSSLWYFLFIGLVFPRDPFLDNIQSQPVNIQKSKLERRIAFFVKRGFDYSLDETLEYYFNLKIREREKATFLVETFGEAKENVELKKVLKSFETTPGPNFFFNNLKELKSIKTPFFKNWMTTFLVRELDINRVDEVLGNPKFFKNALLQTGLNDPSLFFKALEYSLFFNFLDEYKSIVSAHHDSPRGKLATGVYSCRFDYLTSNFESAEKCYDQNKSHLWSEMGLAYTYFLQPAKFKKGVDTYLKTRGRILQIDTLNSVVHIYDVFFLQKFEKEAGSFVNSLDVSSNYWTAFLFLSLNRKKSFLSKNGLARLEREFKMAHRGKLLAEVYFSANTSSEFLKKFNKNSLIYQLLK